MSGDSGYPTILIVSENRDFRDVLIRELQQRGYLILTAQNGVEAHEIVVRHFRHIHLLVADESDGARVMTEKAETISPRHEGFPYRLKPRNWCNSDGSLHCP